MTDTPVVSNDDITITIWFSHSTHASLGAPESVIDADITSALNEAFPGAEIRMGTEWTLTDAPYRVIVGGPEETNPNDLIMVSRQVYLVVDDVLIAIPDGRDQDVPSNPIQEQEPHA
jgi:hypothetical protein